MVRSRILRTVALLISLTAGLGVPPLPSTAMESEPSAARVLVYGDSITQGSSGDWTWRCRLWSHLVSTGGSVDFVGPRNDLKMWRSAGHGSQDYADSSCDRDHASKWGLAFTVPDYDLSDTVANYQPDVVLALVGLNDLVWRGATAEGLADRWRSEVADSRTARPEVDFVLVPVPDTWFSGVPAYNAQLRSLASELDTPGSRVVAAADPGFVRGRDTMDDAHPSANGEVLIAATVADALTGIGVGAAWPRPIAAVPPAPWMAPEPTVSTAEGSLLVQWPFVDYANAMRVQVRDATLGDNWSRTERLTGTYWSGSAAGGHVYDVRLQPVKGNLDGGTLSTAVSVRVPARPSAVTRLRADRLRRCRVRLSWRAAQFATGYEVWIRNATRREPWRLAAPGQVTTTTLTTERLRRHHRYKAYVRSFGPLPGGSTDPIRFRACG